MLVPEEQQPVAHRLALFTGLATVMLLAPTGAAQVEQEDQTTLQVAGLSEPVEIIRDRWGVNHIYARNESDLFFAQGYAAARDRTFQLEMWRRQATGTVAEMLGRRALKRDIGSRLHRFRGNLDVELNHYHARGKLIIESFVRGVNAYIAETERDPSLLPIEFRMLGIKPGRWTPEVVISRHGALVSNVTTEVAFARALKTASIDPLRELLYFQGGEPAFELDDAIDVKVFPDDVLELYSAFRASLDFEPADVAAEFRGAPAADAALARLQHDPAAENPLDIGSNNWVVAGSRTQSTYPILANDPHRTIAAPSLRYMVHLVAPGWNVIGAGEPATPGVSIGHNEHGAWGLTIFGNDNEDLYVYDTNPSNPNEYRYKGQWEAMRVERETIPIKGDKPETVELKFTRHGPVLFEDRANHKAYALRAAWLEPGGAPYLASLRMDQATTWEEFREACAYSNMPAENMVWADRSGTIGWQAAGIQPRRKNWSGLLPVPGDGRYEWDGFLPIKELPHEVNPARGFIVTANNYLMGNDYPQRDAVHFLWADPYRAARITEVLGSGTLFSAAETARLQNDELSLPARALVPLLRDLSLPSGPAAKARDRLRGWDYVLDKDSVAAGIYAMFQRRVIANTRQRLTPPALRTYANQISLKRIIDALYAPDNRFGENPVQARDALLALSLDEAVAELTKRFGSDMDAWQYGQSGFHHALIRHPLESVVNPATRDRLNVGPLPRGGDSYTVNATTTNDNQTSGGSFKIIADTEDWDNSIATNTPGQSGDPDSPHYRDLFELWARGRYFTLAFSREKVEAVKESVTMLQP
jgi:penicillin amidase